MRIDQQVIDLLKTYFVSRRGDSHVAGDVLPGGTDTYKLGAPTNRWDTLYARQVVADSLTGGAGASNADTVDGFHASSISQANTILPLDAGQAYPDTAYPNALLMDGSRTLTGNLLVHSGVTIDGVDIGAHVVDNSHHLGGMAIDDHLQYMHTSSQRTVAAVHTYQPGVPTAPMVLGGNAQDQLVVGFYAGRAVNLDRYVNAGAGLSGGGQLIADVTLEVDTGDNINLTGDVINLDVPGNLSISSTNQVTTAHTHAVVASNNPGASTALLKSGSAGDLYLGGDFGVDSDTLYVDVSEDAVYINAGTLPSRRGALTVHPGDVNQKGLVLEQLSGQVAHIWQVFDSSGNDLILLTNAGDLESGNPGFTSGLTGWQITASGDAEFWNAVVRGELHASVFVADEMHATGGTLAIMTSASVYNPGSSGDNVMGATDGDFYLRMQASWATGLCYFADNDVIRVKFMGDDGGGLDVWDVYLEMRAAPGSVIDRDMGNGEPGYHRLYVRRRSGGGSGLEIPAGTGCVKWGDVGGSGYSGGMLLTSDLSQAPYMDIFTIDNEVTYSPWEALAIKPRVRVGNLDGVLGLGEEWGIAFGYDLSDTSTPYAVFSDQRAALHGVEQSWWDLDGNIRGAVDPTATGNDALFWMGASASDRSLSLDANGLITLSAAMIGPNIEVSFGDGLVWIPPLGNKSTGWINIREWVDFAEPAIETGSVHGGHGKYDAGLAVGRTVKNYVNNAAFIDNIDSWTAGGDGSSVWDSSDYHSGNGSLRILAGTSDTIRYHDWSADVPHASWVTVSCRIKINEGETTGGGRLRIYNKSDSGYEETVVNTVDGEWELVRVRWYNGTGSTKAVMAVLSNTHNDSSAYVWFDSVVVELGPYCSPFFYHDGMPGIGLDTAVASDRIKQNIRYDVNLPTNAYTISLWFEPYNTAGEVSYSSRIFEWYGDFNDRVILYQNSSTNRYTAYHQYSGTVVNINSPTDVAVGAPHHFLMTYDGSRFWYYVDGAYVDDLAAGNSFGTVPNRIWMGTDGAGNNENAGGYISEFFVLSKFVGQEEVTSIYNSASPIGITNDLTFKVYADGHGSTLLSPEGIFYTDKFGRNTLMINTGISAITAGYMTVEPGEILIGRAHTGYPGGAFLIPREGVNALEYYTSSGGLSLIINQSGEVTVGGSTFVAGSRIALYGQASSRRIDFIYNTSQADQEYCSLYTSFNGVDPYASLGVLDLSNRAAIISFYTDASPVLANITMSVYDGVRSGDVTLSAAASEGGSILNIATDKIRFYDAAKYVRTPGGGTDYDGGLYIPLTAMISANNYWNRSVSGSSGVSRTVSSEWTGVPANVKAIVVRMHSRDSVAWVSDRPNTSLFFQMGPNNATTQNDHLTVHPGGEDWWAVAQGIVKVTSNTVYLKWGASGTDTMDVYVGVVGYFI